MDLLAYSFATSTAALQVSKRRTGVGCTEFCVVVQFVRPLKGGRTGRTCVTWTWTWTYDKVGQAEFLRRYDFGKASKFRLVDNGRFYDSKAIAGVAHGFATNDFWTSERPFGGTGPGGAVTILEALGFFIDPGNSLVCSRLPGMST